jgi:hypothetical protein
VFGARSVRRWCPRQARSNPLSISVVSAPLRFFRDSDRTTARGFRILWCSLGARSTARPPPASLRCRWRLSPARIQSAPTRSRRRAALRPRRVAGETAPVGSAYGSLFVEAECDELEAVGSNPQKCAPSPAMVPPANAGSPPRGAVEGRHCQCGRARKNAGGLGQDLPVTLDTSARLGYGSP